MIEHFLKDENSLPVLWSILRKISEHFTRITLKIDGNFLKYSEKLKSPLLNIRWWERVGARAVGVSIEGLPSWFFKYWEFKVFNI